MPKVNVIIPTFNRAYCLERAIDSVLNQTYKDFDLWIVDDGSTDDTSNLVSKYEKLDNFHYVKIENGGVSRARNIGVSKASGEWIAFLDSDDEWLEDKLEKQMSFLENNPSFELIHGEELWVRNGKRVNPKKIHKKSGGDIFERCLALCLISPSAVMLSRKLYEQMGGFDEEFTVCEDYDLWLKITAANEVAFIEDPILIKYGGHEDQLSAKYFAMDYYRIKSMHRLNKEIELSKEKKIALLDMVVRKSVILLKGYKKHDNMKDYDEIESYLLSAQTEIESLQNS